MQVGFTGTRFGMNPAQYAYLQGVLKELCPTWLHHGDCVGADATAHTLARSLHIKIALHPPVDETHRAYCKGSDVEHKPKTHFARNRAIVDATQVLLATPYTNKEESQGGTWYTVRYARKLQRPIAILYPNGICVWENDWMAPRADEPNTQPTHGLTTR